MNDWIDRIWRNKDIEKPQMGQQNLVVQQEEGPQEEVKPISIVSEDMKIETFLNMAGGLEGITNIITETMDLKGLFKNNKPVGNLYIDNPKLKEKIQLNFNEKSELDGKCIVLNQELIFKDGKLISVDYKK